MTYTLELSGLSGTDRRENLSLDEARLEWRRGRLAAQNYTRWELFRDGELVQDGTYERLQTTNTL